jgi:hypothetical protein
MKKCGIMTANAAKPRKRSSDAIRSKALCPGAAHSGDYILRKPIATDSIRKLMAKIFKLCKP